MDDELSPGKVTLDNLFGPEVKVKKKYRKGTLKERFEESFIPEPNSGCWLWEANVDTPKYGRIYVNGTVKGAHRVSYELYKGKFNKKLIIRHKCDNTYCVNPDHLEPGTHKDNMNDKVKRGRQAFPKGENNGKSKLTEEQVMAIFNDDRTNRKIAKDYGINHSHVSSIKRGFTWSHVTGKKYEKKYEKQTEDQVKEIYIKANNGYNVKDLAEEYNMTCCAINSIKRGKNWAWLTKDLL